MAEASAKLDDAQQQLESHRAAADSFRSALPHCLTTHLERVTQLHSRFSALVQQQRQRAQRRRQQQREEERKKRQRAGLDVSTVSEVAAEVGLDFSLAEVEELIEATDALDADGNTDQEEKQREEEQRQEVQRVAEFEQQMRRDWQDRVVVPLASASAALSTSWLSGLSAVVLRLVEEEVRMEKLLLSMMAETESVQAARRKGDNSDDPHTVWSRYEAIIAQVKQELMQQHVRTTQHTAHAQHTRSPARLCNQRLTQPPCLSCLVSLFVARSHQDSLALSN